MKEEKNKPNESTNKKLKIPEHVKEMINKRRRMKNGRSYHPVKTILWIIVLCLFIYAPIRYYSTKHTEIIYVKKKERVQDKYLFFCQQDVYESTDSFVMWKFNSSGIYNKIEEGKTYKVTVVGWRNEFWSLYKNIIKVEEK